MRLFSPKVLEAFDNLKAAKGSVNFSATQLTDPHIVKAIEMMSKASGKPIAEIEQYIKDEVQQFAPKAQLAPILYGTILNNIVEDATFTMFNDLRRHVDIPTGAPAFGSVILGRWVKAIQGEHGDFWPLIVFVDRCPMFHPVLELLNEPNDPFSTKSTGDEENPNIADQIKTAAATPSGNFYFNVPFMQSLMDFSHIKGLKPKNKKYQCNGGPFPDEYAYIDFLIMHELMHYSNDDFYYQHIIPDANPTIINWVGDFRTNYLLVKSGYEQLPMGLFNDDINYDRQFSYIDMYNLVKSEFDKLSKKDQDEVKEKMDQKSDDHNPGQKQGASSDPGKTNNKKPGDIDEHGKKIADEMKKPGKSKTPPDDSDPKGKPDQNAGPGKNVGKGGLIDQNYVPTYNWRDLLSLFVKSAGKGKEETTYTRQHRSGITGIDVMVQRGAGAIKPAVRPQPYVDLKLAFVLDVSGSMSSAIKVVYANAKALLSQPVFAKSEVYILKFSGRVEIYKGIFARNLARKMDNVTSDKKQVMYDSTMTDVFKSAEMGGTTFGAVKTTDMQSLLSQGYNVLLITDTDILDESNLKLVLPLIQSHPKQMFVMLATQRDYNSWINKTNIRTGVTFLGS